MKYVITLFCIVFLGFTSQAQVVLNQVENFQIGDSMVFDVPNVENINVGSGGANQVWDFSNLNVTGTKTQHIIAKSWTKFGAEIPKADLVERTSDGTYAFMTKSGDTNHITGFVDSAQNLVIKYSKPYSFIKQPFTFGDSLVSNYMRMYNAGPGEINGTGNSRTIADGYGKLILPNATYNDVLRIKFEQFSYDAISPTDTQFVYTVTYAWFDAIHKSALLKIDSVSIHSRFFSDQFKEGIILANEFSTSIKPQLKNVSASFNLFQSIDGKLWLQAENQNKFKIDFYALNGQLLKSENVFSNAKTRQEIAVPAEVKKYNFVLIRLSDGTTARTLKVTNF